MNYYAVIVFAIALAGCWWVNRVMSDSNRNDESTHGGGYTKSHHE